MSWSSNTQILVDIIEIMQKFISDEDLRSEIYEELLDVFENNGFDDFEDCYEIDDILDEILKDTGRVDDYEDE